MENKSILKVNQLENKFVFDGNQWLIHEIIFNSNTKLFLIVNLKTEVILGSCLGLESINATSIGELYFNILDSYSFQKNPEIIYSNLKLESKIVKVKELFEKENIHSCFIADENHSNKFLKLLNEQIKALITKILITKDTKPLREWRKNLPNKLKRLTIEQKSTNPEFHQLLFESKFFELKKLDTVQDAIEQYNQNKISFIESKDLILVKAEKENKKSISNVKEESLKKIHSEIEIDQKVNQVASLVVENHHENILTMQQGFIGLATQNKALMSQNEALRAQIDLLQEHLETVVQELNERKEKERLIQEKKDKWKNRKRLPKRQPITTETYQFLIENSNKLRYARSYRGVRLRLALALLAVTGCRVSELLPLKMEQVETLFLKHWIPINRVKRGPANHKAFLTKEGARIIKERRSDFEFMWHYKEKDSYIFTAENSNKPLEREAFTNLINKFIKDCARKLETNPILSSHSFRVGFITQLWKDTNDIEFVRQTIGHARLDTTSQYVENLSEKEIQNRMLEVNSKNGDLKMTNDQSIKESLSDRYKAQEGIEVTSYGQFLNKSNRDL